MIEVVSTMVKLFFIMGIGYIAARRGKLDKESNTKLSYVVCNLSLPGLILDAVLNVEKDSGAFTAIEYLIGGVVFYICIPFVAFVLCKLMKVKKDDMGTMQLMLCFSNCTFMGYPVLQAFLGKEAVFASSIFNMPFNLMIYSFGIYLIQKGNGGEGAFQWKNVINPVVISSILAIVIDMCSLDFPNIVKDCCATLGAITTPLSMIVLGVSLAQVSLKEAFTDVQIYILSFFRLLIIPLITYGIVSLVSQNEILIGVATITAAMPVASMCFMLSTLYHGNQKKAAVGVFISTLFSGITIPVIVGLLF